MSYQRGNLILADLGVDTMSITKSYTKRRLNRAVKKSFDGDMYDVIKPYLLKADKHLASEVEKAVKDRRITKNFCIEKSLYDQIDRFTDLKSFRPSMQGKDAYEWAWQLICEIFPKPSRPLKPLVFSDPSDVNEIFSNPDASAGYLAYPKHKREVPELIFKVAQRIMQDYDRTISFPAIALTRSQISDFIDENGNIDSKNIKHKTRLVMCVDAASVLVEQRLGQPLLDYIFKSQPQYAGGKNDYAIRDFLLRDCRGKRWVSLDYSKFDATIQNWLIRDVFTFLKRYFGPEEDVAFEWITNNFINMQILMPNGRIIDMHKGIKSGSYFTQIVGSLANLVMILTYMCYKFGTRQGNRIINVDKVRDELMSYSRPNEPRFYTMVSMGDDNIFFTRSKIDMKELSSYLFHNFGAIITVEGDKGYDEGTRSDPPHFLKRTWTMNGQMREELDMIVNLLHPERRRSYKDYSPWHIIYGYHLTFEGTMRKIIPRDQIIVNLHDSNGGFNALSNIRLIELPGSLRSQILNRGVNRDDLVRNLERNHRMLRQAVVRAHRRCGNTACHVNPTRCKIGCPSIGLSVRWNTVNIA
jgi:hypothetical protein